MLLRRGNRGITVDPMRSPGVRIQGVRFECNKLEPEVCIIADQRSALALAGTIRDVISTGHQRESVLYRPAKNQGIQRESVGRVVLQQEYDGLRILIIQYCEKYTPTYWMRGIPLDLAVRKLAEGLEGCAEEAFGLLHCRLVFGDQRQRERAAELLRQISGVVKVTYEHARGDRGLFIQSTQALDPTLQVVAAMLKAEFTHATMLRDASFEGVPQRR